MLAVRVDTFPLVVTTFGDGFGEEDFAQFREAHTAILERHHRYVSVLDTSALVTMPSFGLRDSVADFVRIYSDDFGSLCLSTEIVVTNVAARTALAAMQWFVPEHTKVTLHAALRPAVSRALDAVWTNQLEATAATLAYHDEIMSTSSMPPVRDSGSFAKRALSSSIEGLLRRARSTDKL